MARIEAGVNFGELEVKYSSILRFRAAIKRSLDDHETNAYYPKLGILARDMGITVSALFDAITTEAFTKFARERDAEIEAKPLDQYPEISRHANSLI